MTQDGERKMKGGADEDRRSRRGMKVTVNATGQGLDSGLLYVLAVVVRL